MTNDQSIGTDGRLTDGYPTPNWHESSGIPMTNDQVREILYHARLYLLGKNQYSDESEALQLLARIEMGLAYNVSAPGRGI